MTNWSPSDSISFVRRACLTMAVVGGCGGVTAFDGASDAPACTESPPDAAADEAPLDAAPVEEDVAKAADAATCGKTDPSAYVTQVALGAGRTCALMSDGTVQCWGLAPLGDGTSSNHDEPVQVSCLSGIVDIAAGTRHVCAVRNDGAVLCWGNNQFEQIGIGTIGVDVLAPKVVVGLDGFVEVAVGGDHTCARRGDGTMSCWGDASRT